MYIFFSMRHLFLRQLMIFYVSQTMNNLHKTGLTIVAGIIALWSSDAIFVENAMCNQWLISPCMTADTKSRNKSLLFDSTEIMLMFRSA